MRDPDSNPTTRQSASTAGVPTSRRPCSLLQGRQAQGSRIGVRGPDQHRRPPSVIPHPSSCIPHHSLTMFVICRLPTTVR